MAGISMRKFCLGKQFTFGSTESLAIPVPTMRNVPGSGTGLVEGTGLVAGRTPRSNPFQYSLFAPTVNDRS